MHGDLIHVPPSELHALTSPWPFSVWGIDIIGKISPKSSSGHEGVHFMGEVDTLIRVWHSRSRIVSPLRGLISDPRGKFRPTWSGSYVIHGLFFLHFTLSHRLPSSPVSIISIRFTSISYYGMMTCSCPVPGSLFTSLFSSYVDLLDAAFLGGVVRHCHALLHFIPTGFSIFFSIRSSLVLSIFIFFFHPCQSLYRFLRRVLGIHHCVS
ncbi:hypothetical protein AAG906_027224 [Vitis piasezkii]